jgi:hypothetical protein
MAVVPGLFVRLIQLILSDHDEIPVLGFAQREKELNTRGTRRTQKAQKGLRLRSHRPKARTGKFQRKEAADSLVAFGSTPDFFMLNEDGTETEGE